MLRGVWQWVIHWNVKFIDVSTRDIANAILGAVQLSKPMIFRRTKWLLPWLSSNHSKFARVQGFISAFYGNSSFYLWVVLGCDKKRSISFRNWAFASSNNVSNSKNTFDRDLQSIVWCDTWTVPFHLGSWRAILCRDPRRVAIMKE